MLVSILGAVPSALAVDTELIDVLRQRTLNSGSLTAGDVETIDTFWNEATDRTRQRRSAPRRRPERARIQPRGLRDHR